MVAVLAAPREAAWAKIKSHPLLRRKGHKITLNKYHDAIMTFRKVMGEVPIKGYLYEYCSYKLGFKFQSSKKALG